jgi:dTDP-4-dehydrorhamnose reductase
MRVLIAGYPGQLAKAIIAELIRNNIVFLAPPHYDFDITNITK